MKLRQLFERVYRSAHQLPYNDLTSNNILEHIILCFKDPECLREMANTSKSSVELPCNVWLDCGKSYKKSRHYKRMKFQKDHQNRINNNFAEIKLNGEIVKSTNYGSSLTDREEKEIQNFVLNNQECLSLLSDGEILISDFLNIVIKGGEPASELEKQIQKNELKVVLKRYEC